MRIGCFRRFFCGRRFFCLGFLTLAAVSTFAGQFGENHRSDGQSQATLAVPSGTILPVRLNQTFSSRNAKTGEMISARIMQDVPLPNGRKIPAGAKVTGRITSVQAAANGTQGKIELRFDTLLIHHQSIPVVTVLRALAGFMEVQDAQTPEYSPGFGTPYYWVPTRQIGGDEVYGVGGPVTNQSSERVGTGVYDGVLVHVRTLPNSKCRGPLEEEDRLQALWVFSSDACGVYGLDHVEIAHAGRTDPAGTILLTSDAQDLKLRTGDALLLRLR